ncbi:MAG TPA: hypothetical protein VE988_04855 [Gemmataceae bacterium]|nr:hypothetical protein [Gemmataceae bacterium]
MPQKALVLGTDSRVLLSVIRSLGRGGVQVHVAADAPDYAALRSRYVHQVHSLPPVEDDIAWKRALLDLMRRQHFDLVIPCTDCEVLSCHRHRHELEQYGKVWAPNDKAQGVLFDKFKTNELARSLEVPAAREIIVTKSCDYEQMLNRFGRPLVLKPARSYDPARLGHLHSVRKAYDAESFQQLLGEMLTDGPVAIQENFIGIGVGVELLLDAGQPLLAFQHRRVHEPLHGGPSSYRQSQALSPELLAASLRILQAVEYTGVAMVEFKVNEALGTWVFLEVNARFWGSLPLALAAGADFPFALFQFLVNGRREFDQRYREGVYCRNWSLDLEWQRLNRHADHSDPTLASRPLSAVCKDLCRNVLAGREHSDTFTLDDPRPGLAEIFQLARRMGAKLLRCLPGLKNTGVAGTNLAGSLGQPQIVGRHERMLGNALR